MDEIEEEGRRKKRAVAYDATRALEFFAAIDLDRVAARTQLNLIIKACFFTGARIGEVIGLRWRDFNLTDQPVHASDPEAGDQVIPPHSVWINGNIVRVTGKGIRRHSGKTSGSVGVVELAPAMVSMLEMVRPPNARPDDPVFPSGTGSWRDPNTLQTSIRRLRTRVDFPDFTSHIGRKTHGTALDAAGLTAREIADQLRKASVRDVQETYMGRGLVNKAAAGLMDAFFRPNGQ
jgi:integrase